MKANEIIIKKSDGESVVRFNLTDMASIRDYANEKLIEKIKRKLDAMPIEDIELFLMEQILKNHSK